jgi:DNA-binding NtrC family response regulator
LFREDLYYRLNVISITMPPLREIREDIPLLINHFIAKHQISASAASPEVSPEAMAKLMAYAWPGNVRQLENVVRRAFALGINGFLDIDDLPKEIARQTGKPMLSDSDLNLKTVERKTIQQALRKAGGNKAEAAKLLGVNTTTVYRKMARYDIQDDR